MELWRFYSPSSTSDFSLANYLHQPGPQVRGVESLECGHDQDLSYRLPPLVEVAQKRWIRTFHDGAVIAAILTIVSIEFVTHNLQSSSEVYASASALAILSHVSFIFNLSAVFSAVILAKKIGGLAEAASRRDNSAPQTGYITAGGPLLRWYGLKKPWFLLMAHWAVCFSFGIGCLFAQIMLHASNTRSSSVRTATACVLGFAAMPLVFAFRLLVN
ncbi:hypothetical protein PM082_012015 [Marasmius tenuissimus]|nr:hypothetical protein PM082_012015 [Marasmius tenuissimus]